MFRVISQYEKYRGPGRGRPSRTPVLAKFFLSKLRTHVVSNLLYSSSQNCTKTIYSSKLYTPEPPLSPEPHPPLSPNEWFCCSERIPKLSLNQHSLYVRVVEEPPPPHHSQGSSREKWSRNTLKVVTARVFYVLRGF